MGYLLSLRLAIFYFFIITATPSVAADNTLEKIQKDIVGSWIVDVKGETRPRTLNIKGAEIGQDGAWILDSTYGWIDGTPTAVNAILIANSQGYSLRLTTQAKSQISAEYVSADRFNGTFSWISGKVKAATLQRLSVDEIAKRATDSRMKLTIKQPTEDVPPSCAGFVGGWTGNWPGYGQAWLWVVSANANCVVNFATTSTSDFPKAFLTAEIKDGVLALQKRQGIGSESYELHGNELWARYLSTSGDSNNTVFRKMQPNGK